jgi:hypothetical protein
MSFSMTRTAVESFTLTQAKYLASKVAADMRRCQQLYGKPKSTGGTRQDPDINDYGTEIALMLRDKYIATFEFGFVRDTDNERLLTWKYSVDSAGDLTSDDRPGRIVSGVDIKGASFRSYMTYSDAWSKLTEEQKAAYKEALPVGRVGAAAYGSSLGSFQYDLAYSSTGVAMVRQTFKLYGT